MRQARKKAHAHEQKAAIAVLEEDALLGIREQVAHAQAFDLLSRGGVPGQIRSKVFQDNASIGTPRVQVLIDTRGEKIEEHGPPVPIAAGHYLMAQINTTEPPRFRAPKWTLLKPFSSVYGRSRCFSGGFSGSGWPRPTRA